MDRQTFTYYPTKIGDFVHIGKDAVVEAAQVGQGVEIGEGAIIVCASLIISRLTPPIIPGILLSYHAV